MVKAERDREGEYWLRCVRSSPHSGLRGLSHTSLLYWNFLCETTLFYTQLRPRREAERETEEWNFHWALLSNRFEVYAGMNLGTLPHTYTLFQPTCNYTT